MGHNTVLAVLLSARLYIYYILFITLTNGYEVFSRKYAYIIMYVWLKRRCSLFKSI